MAPLFAEAGLAAFATASLAAAARAAGRGAMSVVVLFVPAVVRADRRARRWGPRGPCLSSLRGVDAAVRTVGSFQSAEPERPPWPL